MINFSGRHFKKDLIMMAIRWYVAYTLSYRDIEELMAERGIQFLSTKQKNVLNFKLQVIFFNALSLNIMNISFKKIFCFLS